MLPEPVYTVRSFEQVISAPPVKAMPMVILTADLPPISADDVASGVFPPAVTVEFVNALWSAQIAAQSALAAEPGVPIIRPVSTAADASQLPLRMPA